MANKKISELVNRTPSLTDLMLVGDPSSGYSYKCTITELSTLLEANVSLNDLNDVIISTPTNGQVLTYNGTNWVNGNNGITEINGLTAASQSFAVGTSGTDFAIVSSTSTHTFNLPTASATNRGALSSTDWSTFNNKIGGSGTTNYVSKFTASGTIGNSAIQESSGNTAINGTIISNADFRFLTVYGNAAGFGGVFQSRTSNNSVVGNFYTDSNGVWFGAGSTSPILFNIGVLEVMRFDTSGNAGIGIAAPAAKLDVNGDLKLATIVNATTDTDRFLVSDSGVIKYRTGTQVLSDIGGAAASSISGTTNYIPKFTSSSAIGNSIIYDDGTNVGIGTTSATSFSMKLAVVNNIGLIPTTQNTVGSAVFLKSQLGSSGGENFISNEITTFNNAANYNTSLIFLTRSGTSATERMRLDASGNLGLGTSSPQSKFHLYSAVGTATELIRMQSDWNNPSGNKSITWADATNVLGRISVSYSAPAAKMTFGSLYNSGYQSSDLMTLDASGNLGLGVTPSAWSASYKAIQISSYAAITQGGNDTYIGNNWYNDGTNKYLQTNGASLYGQSNGSHVWYTAPSGTAGNAISFTQAMTLDASGNLFLGATGTSLNSVRGIAINGGATNDVQLRLQNNNTGTSGSDGILLSLDGSSNAYLWNYENAATLFGTNNSERMRITSGGLVGIGTSSPSSILHLQTSAGTASKLYLGQSATAAWSVGNNASANTFSIIDEQFSATRLFISSTGNIGIGTSSPDVILHVSGTTGTAKIASTSTTAANYPYLTFLHAGNDEFRIGGGDGLRFLSSGTTERMRITSGGLVLIGTTSTSGVDKLRVNNDGTTSYSTVNITNANSTANMYVGVAGSAVANGSLQNNAYVWNAAASALVLGTSDNERMRITSGGEVLIGTTTDAGLFKLQVDGNIYGSGLIQILGSIETGNPNGGTSKRWKLGSKVAASVSFDPDNYIEVDLNGTLYKLALAQ